MIWDFKWWYVASVFVCLLVAGFYIYRTPHTYLRSTKVIIDESDQDATMRNLGVASANMMRLRSFNSVENEIQAFSSPGNQCWLCGCAAVAHGNGDGLLGCLRHLGGLLLQQVEGRKHKRRHRF